MQEMCDAAEPSCRSHAGARVVQGLFLALIMLYGAHLRALVSCYMRENVCLLM